MEKKEEMTIKRAIGFVIIACGIAFMLSALLLSSLQFERIDYSFPEESEECQLVEGVIFINEYDIPERVWICQDHNSSFFRENGEEVSINSRSLRWLD